MVYYSNRIYKLDVALYVNISVPKPLGFNMLFRIYNETIQYTYTPPKVRHSSFRPQYLYVSVGRGSVYNLCIY